MKRALLDVNVLLALLDASHAFHSQAHQWWKANASFGWASCPLTENGLVRIMTNPSYSRSCHFMFEQVVNALRHFVDATDHEFWPDDLSIRDAALFRPDRIHGSRQVTDSYLLALAVKNRGRLATFDQGITISAVTHATAAHLCLI